MIQQNIVMFIRRHQENLCQYHTDKPAPDNNNNITDFPANSNNSILFKFKQQITGHTRNGGTKNVEIICSYNGLKMDFRCWYQNLK